MVRRSVLSVLLLIGLLAPGLLAAAQEPAGENDLLRLLGAVPDVPQVHDTEIYYGDIAAWHTSWGIPRVPNVNMLKMLPREQFSRWTLILSEQTVPPQALGFERILGEDMRAVYGFDFFQADRFIHIDTPPDDVALVESAFFNAGQIEAKLGENGYTSDALADPWTLYSLGEDYQTNIDATALPMAGRLGVLNRIAVGDQQLLIGRATQNVSAAVDASSDEIDSLADNPLYVAGASALLDPALADTGELVGAILTAQAYAADPAVLLGPSASSEAISAFEQRLADSGMLPPYALSVFGTRHSAEQAATFLILGLVFSGEVDAADAAGIVADRIEGYQSLTTGAPLADQWTLDRALGVDVDGFPVALVVMRIDDPVTAPDAELPNVRVLSWFRLLVTRDLGFMIPGPFDEN